MNPHLATALLAPILIAQGRYVRRVTPRLPEPAGRRHGIAGSGPPIRLLIIGDSAAAGVGVETQAQALSGRLVTSLASTHEVSWQVLARTGDTSSQVLARLESQSKKTFDFVVISVGVNDATARTGSAAWVENLERIIAVLQNRFQARHILLSSLPPMHRFPALPQPLRWWLGVRAQKLNGLMAKVAAQDAGCRLITVPYPSQKDAMAADGFHPGAFAYDLWGSHLAGIIQAEIGVHRS